MRNKAQEDFVIPMDTFERYLRRSKAPNAPSM